MRIGVLQRQQSDRADRLWGACLPLYGLVWLVRRLVRY